MNKKIISGILVVSLLNLVGCYSGRAITKKLLTTRELSRIEDLNGIEIYTTDSNHYSFERYTNKRRMLLAPQKYYYRSWLVKNDTLNVSGLSLNKMRSESTLKLKEEKLILPFAEIIEISMRKSEQADYAAGMTLAIVLAAVVALLIATLPGD